MQRTHIALLAVAVWGCADREIDLGVHLEELHRADGEGGTITVSGCLNEDGALTQRACVTDSTGTNYAVGNDLVVTSAVPPYGGYVEFLDGLVLDADSVVTEGPDAPIKAYAAPYNVEGDPCCAESGSANRIAVRASVVQEGGLLTMIDDALPSGTQISIDISLGALLRAAPGHGEFGDLCPGGGFDCAGYTFRFYVGEEPPVTGTPNPDVKAETKSEGTTPSTERLEPGK